MDLLWQTSLRRWHHSESGHISCSELSIPDPRPAQARCLTPSKHQVSIPNTLGTRFMFVCSLCPARLLSMTQELLLHGAGWPEKPRAAGPGGHVLKEPGEGSKAGL